MWIKRTTSSRGFIKVQLLLFHPIKGCAPIDYSASGGHATGATKVKAGRVPMDEDTVPVINVELLLMGMVTVAEVKPGVTVNIPDMGSELGVLGEGTADWDA